MSSYRRPLVVGNWKMNGLRASGISLADEISKKLREMNPTNFDLVICPPATLLGLVVDAVRDTNIGVGGQDCHRSDSGAHTGDLSAEMLKDIGCSHVIIGHSERRVDHGETNELVKSKAEVALREGLIVIICVGEAESERDQGVTIDIVTSQISNSIPDGATFTNCIFAYEPIWAIGTGRTPTSDEVQEVHAMMRKTLRGKIGSDKADKMSLLYGGSVKSNNAVELMVLADVDGALVGGASLSHAEFFAIGESCPK
jgi:triosephosphate isomerase